MKYLAPDFNNDDFVFDLIDMLSEYGIYAIENVIDDDTCDMYYNEIFNILSKQNKR